MDWGTILVAFIAAVLGATFSRFNEQTNWRRDRRAEAYLNFIAAARSFLDGSELHTHTPLSSSAQQDNLDTYSRLQQLSRKITAAADHIEVIGSTEAFNMASGLDYKAATLVGKVRDFNNGTTDPEAVTKIGREIGNTLDEFVPVVRKELRSSEQLLKVQEAVTHPRRALARRRARKNFVIPSRPIPKASAQVAKNRPPMASPTARPPKPPGPRPSTST